MTSTHPHVRRSGAGTPVVCLHSSLSSAKQWLPLMSRLMHSHEVIAPDLSGYGKSPTLEVGRRFSLDDELRFLKPVLDSIDEPFHLVGHSYGAATALKAASEYRDKIRSLSIYEPVLFCLLHQEDPAQPALTEVLEVESDVREQVEQYNLPAAGKRFIDYWSGDGEYDNLPQHQQQVVDEKIVKVVADFEAILDEPTKLDDYRELDIPTLFLYGKQSPPSTQRIAHLLSNVMPACHLEGMPGLAHMGPLTHPEMVSKRLADFIRERQAQIDAAARRSSA